MLASRVLGVARESLFAALFGATWLADAYVIAFRIPNLLRDLFAEGALSSAFVPTFTEAFARDGRERAFQLANRVLTGVLLCTGAGDAWWVWCSPGRSPICCRMGSGARWRGRCSPPG